MESVHAKNLKATLLFVDFSKTFDSIHRGKTEQILLAYGHPKEAVAAMMMLYKNTKVKVRLPDGDTDFFDIVVCILQGNAFAPYLFIICLDNVFRTLIELMKKNSFTLTKAGSRRYSARTITDADYSNDIVLLANTPAPAESLLHIWEPAAGGIGLHISIDKTESMCFSQRGNISTQNGRFWNLWTNSPTS